MSLSEPSGNPPGDLWRVDYEAAYDRWLASEPPDEVADRVLEWVDECELHGPPAPPDSVQVFPEDDLYAFVIPDTEAGENPPVSVAYLVVTYERLVLVRDFGSD